ncbi:MAG: hypothetical protein C4K49_00795 [Candidatus Thorarchaeota archaeon]|nr:MAG: hypothetical protein C4K49_00795 [Candidatus Thorarchaeota archaeon]
MRVMVDMKPGLEEKLKKLVLRQSARAARNEWVETQSSSDEPLFDYRYDHVSQVVVTAKRLAVLTGADMEVTMMASWLHDMAKPGIGGGENHGDASAALAREILLREDVSQTTVDKVCDAIRKHVGLTLNEPLAPLEAQVLWDADKIVKLGLVGFIHYIINGIKLRPGMDMAEIADEIRDFIPLAEKIAASMNTLPGKGMAATRLEHLKMVSGYLDREIGQVSQVENEPHAAADAPGSLKAGILTIGNEILDGLVLDTNSNWLELRLAALGVATIAQVTVRDDLAEIGNALSRLQGICSIIITSGGLGPTHDDMTLSAVSNRLGLELAEDPNALSIVKKQYEYLYAKGIVSTAELTESRKKMAHIPKGSKPLDNSVGGAPGVMISRDETTIFCLPGVPAELKAIFDASVRPWIEQKGKPFYYEETVDFAISDETMFAPFIDKAMRKHPGVYIKSMPKTYGTSDVLRVWVSARGNMHRDLKASVKGAIRTLAEVSGVNASPVVSSTLDGR